MDKEIVFPAAFTSELMITDEIWNNVCERHRLSQSPDSIMCFFERDLQAYIQKKLAETDVNNAEIAVINWVNTSGKRIEMLKERASFLKEGQ